MLPEIPPHQLAPSQYPLVRHLGVEPHLSLVIKAVIAGHSPASIWVDEGPRPQTALLWDKGHCLYVLSAAASAPSWLHTLIHQTIIPEARARHIRLLKVYHQEAGWADIIPTLLAPLALTLKARAFYRLDPSYVPGTIPVPPGFTLQPITAPLLANDDLENIQSLRNEIASCWPTLARFLRHGFGFCLVHGTKLVSWCTAEYRSAGQCGVGIETIEAYQGRGLATAATLAFVTHSQKHRLVPHWDSWQANTPSLAVAQKAGFRHLLDYTVHLGFLS